MKLPVRLSRSAALPAVATLPLQISDVAFWRLVTGLWEPISDVKLASRPGGQLPSYLDLLRLLKDPCGPSAGLRN